MSSCPHSCQTICAFNSLVLRLGKAVLKRLPTQPHAHTLLLPRGCVSLHPHSGLIRLLTRLRVSSFFFFYLEANYFTEEGNGTPLQYSCL